MKTYLDCIPCFFKQALFAARIAVDDETVVKEVLNKMGRLVPQIPMNNSPPETGREVYRIVREVTGVEDPFRPLKSESITKALKLYPELEKLLAAAADPLETAVRLAIAGNVIDFAASPDFQLEEDIQDILQKPLAINDYHALKDKLRSARRVLYLADNAGETVFDKLLIRTMGVPVTYAVREKPIINDATKEDAIASGVDEVAEIVSSGCDSPGTVLGQCSELFLEYFQAADIIISKGQGNYESLSNEKRPVFYLLKAKCPVIARDLGVEAGDIVVKYSLSEGGSRQIRSP